MTLMGDRELARSLVLLVLNSFWAAGYSPLKYNINGKSSARPLTCLYVRTLYSCSVPIGAMIWWGERRDISLLFACSVALEKLFFCGWVVTALYLFVLDNYLWVYWGWPKLKRISCWYIRSIRRPTFVQAVDWEYTGIPCFCEKWLYLVLITSLLLPFISKLFS